MSVYVKTAFHILMERNRKWNL